MVSPDVAVGEAVSTTGRFGGFDAEEQERAASGSVKVDAFETLLQGAMDKTFLPEKWNANNAKLSLKNSIIDWLVKNKLGWQAALAKYVGLMFVSAILRLHTYMQAVHHLEMMCGPHQSECWVHSIKGGLRPCGLVSNSDWCMTLSRCLKLQPIQSVSLSTAASLPQNYYLTLCLY